MTDAAERPQSVSQQIAARNQSGIAVLGLSPGYTLCTRLCLGTEAAGVSVLPWYGPGRPQTSITVTVMMHRLSPCHAGLQACAVGMFITSVPITKLFAWGEGDNGGHVSEIGGDSLGCGVTNL